MLVSVLSHRGAEKTGREMKRLINQYSHDIIPLHKLPIIKYFDKIKNIPYRNDQAIFSDRSEIIARPKYLLNKGLYPKLDCKKKQFLFVVT